MSAQVLVNSVSRDISAYYLPREVIEQYRLAPENYGDQLFIHPPLYVYLCVALKRLLGLSLPGVSLTCHAVTCLLMSALPSALCRLVPLHGRSGHSSQWEARVALWAVTIYAFCPIVSFVSQKVSTFFSY